MQSAYTPKQERVDDLRLLSLYADFKPVRYVGENEECGLGYWVINRQWGALAEGDEIACVTYADTGIAFTPIDWQAPQPDMDDDREIAETDWIDEDGNGAIIMDGLPVKAV